MSNSIAAYGAATSLTITLTSVANNAARESLKVDNTTNRFLDALLEFSVTLGGVPTGDVEVYLAASLAGSVWPDAVTGADAALTIADVRNLIYMGTIACPAAGPNRAIWPTSMGPNAALTLPPWWSIVLLNKSGQTITAGSVRFLGSQVAEG